MTDDEKAIKALRLLSVAYNAVTVADKLTLAWDWDVVEMELAEVVEKIGKAMASLANPPSWVAESAMLEDYAKLTKEGVNNEKED